MNENSKLGLVLSGGGARAAYQAGVIQALVEISEKLPGGSETFPFKIVTGVSAGAINAGYFASQAHQPRRAARHLTRLWKNIDASKVIRTDPLFFLDNFGNILFNLLFRRFRKTSRLKPPYSFLSAEPLRQLLEARIDFDQLRKNIEDGVLESVAITATDYQNSNSISFVEGLKVPTWKRKRRFGIPAKLAVEHILASASIPIFFSPIAVAGRYFGDGTLRNIAPLSPAIHLNASRLVIVSVKKPIDAQELPSEPTQPPSPAKVFSLILNALILDQTDFDMERLARINRTLDAVDETEKPASELRPIDYIWIQPSEDLGELAKTYAKNLPRIIKFLLKPLGSLEQASEMVSFLLFDREYCSRLVEIGYRDCLNKREEIENFILSTKDKGKI